MVVGCGSMERMSNMIAELFYLDTSIWVKAPYNILFVAEVKSKIPKDYRKWDPDERVWVINYCYEDKIIAICSTYFEDIAYYGEKKYSSKSIQSSPAYETLFLLPGAPKEVVIATYRALSKLYHPDVSNKPNTTERMKEINIAFDNIMGRR